MARGVRPAEGTAAPATGAVPAADEAAAPTPAPVTEAPKAVPEFQVVRAAQAEPRIQGADIYQLQLADLIGVEDVLDPPKRPWPSILLMVEPALNPLWSWMMHGEVPGLWSLGGGTLILGATLLKGAVDARGCAHRGRRCARGGGERRSDGAGKRRSDGATERRRGKPGTERARGSDWEMMTSRRGEARKSFLRPLRGGRMCWGAYHGLRDAQSSVASPVAALLRPAGA